VGEMELVFDRLARAACLWRWVSLSLPHTRGTEDGCEFKEVRF
jgi:hypothetical protein